MDRRSIGDIPPRPKTDKLPNQEYLLREYVGRLERFKSSRRAVHIHLSRLRAHNRREHHIRVALNTFEGLIKQYDGRLFLLSNNDIVFICKGGDIDAIDDAVMRVRYLFDEDPLTVDDDDTGQAFCTWYDLEFDYQVFLAKTETICVDATRREKRLAAITRGDELRGTERALPPLDPARLGELIDTLARADLTNVMRRQAVCTLPPDSAPLPIFRELFISIGDLRDVILPNYNITSDRWLFQHLTQVLDLRMLALLLHHEDRVIQNSISLNLNVPTILSPEFLAFDASLKSGARGTIVIELQMVDIFADLGGYLFARDFARERGYRICLDGITEQTLGFVDREKLGLDIVKLFWDPMMVSQPRPERLRELVSNVNRIGKTRTVLCRCDSPDAVHFGQALGVAMYQGRHIDKLIQANAVSPVRAARIAAAAAIDPK